jgi:hypothetical protein
MNDDKEENEFWSDHITRRIVEAAGFRHAAPTCTDLLAAARRVRSCSDLQDFADVAERHCVYDLEVYDTHIEVTHPTGSVMLEIYVDEGTRALMTDEDDIGPEAVCAAIARLT